MRVLHLVDDAPSANGDVMREAAALLGLPPPPSVPFAEAVKCVTCGCIVLCVVCGLV